MKGDAARRKLAKEIDQAVAGWVEAGLVADSGWQGRPLLATPLPLVDGIWFDTAAVERVLRFFAMLRQLIGRWAGKPFRLYDWQVRHLVAPVFGLKHPTGLRVIRTVWFEIPRKNGKSTLCSGLALYLLMADREARAEVYAAAGDRHQAGIVFGAARDMADAAPQLKKRLGRGGIQRKLLRHPKTRSVFEAISSEGLRSHGLNVHGGVIDEVHVHKNPDVIDALETGTGAREQPLIVFITTADAGAEGSVYSTKREEVEQLAGGHALDPTIFGVVFGVDDKAEGFDPFSEQTLRAANPGYDLTVLGDYLEGKANQAKRSPAQLNRYLRLHLNVRTKQTTRFIDLNRWDQSAQAPGSNIPIPLDLEALAGRTCIGGLDLSSTTDLTAFSLLFPPEEEGGDWPWIVWHWLPEDRIRELTERTQLPFERWSKTSGPMGPLLRLTEGDVVDYRAVRSFILDDLRARFNIVALGYDPYKATETALALGDAGLDVEPVRQGYLTLSEPTKLLERLVLQRKVRHGGNPLLRWEMDCLEVKQDEAGNIKPVKPDYHKSTKRIDGPVSGVTALACHIARVGFDRASKYEDDDLLVI